MNTTCFDVFEQCVLAVLNGDLIQSVSAKDKEFHFQNWFEGRISRLGFHFQGKGRNTYPDYSLVEFAEGYELKALAWPGREKDYDSNSQVPTGFHNGRQIFYVFGRYPADLSPYDEGKGQNEYPVVDPVICHGDFLNADNDYVHKNKNVKVFGTYGDIMIRDRKMYVAPTPFALTNGTTGLMTLIIPSSLPLHPKFTAVGKLVRKEAESLVVAYTFDLEDNTIEADTVDNPNAGKEHSFMACRLKTQSDKPVTIVVPTPPSDQEIEGTEEEE